MAMSRYNIPSSLDIRGVQSRPNIAASPLGQYHSRVGEVRSIQEELRTLQAHQGQPRSQLAGMPGYSIASHIRDATDRLMQKEKEMEVLKAGCQELGVYREPSDSDSDCIDSMSELGPGHMTDAPSTAVPSLHNESFFSRSCEPDPFYTSQQVFRPPYLDETNCLGNRDAMQQAAFDESGSECEQELLRIFWHKKLPSVGSHIRLLRLMAAVPSRREIDCEVVHGDLDDCNLAPFEALSYVWGEPPREASIRIRKDGVLFRMPVSQNLFSALQCLRQKRRNRMLWVDAICIDQNDLKERSLQVRRMGDIYRMASRVCVWLGEADLDSNLAMDFIQHNVLLKSVEEICRDRDAMYGWAALANFMRRPWFSRRWVVQELSLSNEARLHCGARSMAWPDFADAVSIFVEAEAVSQRYQEVIGRDSKTYSFWCEEVSMLGASRLVDITSNLLRPLAGKREPLMSLEHLVARLSTFDVAEPHDAIYSLLGLANDIEPACSLGGGYCIEQSLPTRSRIDAWASRYLNAKLCQIDYSLPFVELCKDFVVFSIAQSASVDPSGALDIICRHWAPNSWNKEQGHNADLGFDRDSLPSWIPDLTGAAYSSFTQVNSKLGIGRRNGDSLVGLPGISPRNYSAGGTHEVDLETLRFVKHGNGYAMLVSGFILDEVLKVEVASQGGHIPEEWFESTVWNNTNRNPSEEFWRIIVANRGFSGRNPPIYYKRASTEYITKGLPNGSLDTAKLIKEGGNSIVSDYFKRVQSVIWNRSLMRTKSNRLGIVNKQAHTGDLICILYGCSVPVILRRYVKADDMTARENKELEFVNAKLEAFVIRLQRAFRRRRDCRYVPKPMTASLDSGTSEATPQRSRDWRAGMQQKRLYSPGSGSPLSKKEDEKYWYTLIGECYVHGMMDGEAISYQYEHGIKTQTFELR